MPIQRYNEKCQELDEYMVGALADRRQLVEKYKTCKGKLKQHETDLNEVTVHDLCYGFSLFTI